MLKAPPSSNWLALQKKLPKKAASTNQPQRKRRKIETNTLPERSPSPEIPQNPGPSYSHSSRESVETLQKMVRGELDYTEAQLLPGKYLALDCEMVGVGIEGAESSLARVSVVNFHGAIQMDEFVRQKERVVDYRTQWSGVRPSDMVNAKPFEEIQKQVADLIKDRILVGHAVHNDLKALLLSHPRPQTRDTQSCAGKFKVTKSRRPALRDLVKQELDLVIQGGEHSSVTDARATMAVYRIHRKEWDRGTRPLPAAFSATDDTKDDATTPVKKKKKRKREEDDEETSSFPGGGRKGVSSGLSTVIRRNGKPKAPETSDAEWWKALPTKAGAKGSVRIKSSQ
ncbi:ribonuclease H-like domain-containing protein [Mycena floridula]|nr:ribonuclease H-like domain-containing protein [Mycena floridula]